MKKMILTNIILILTVTATALIAGLYYSYSCSVNPGLAKLSDREYMSAMQSINSAILNPLFFSSFMGTLILLPLSAYLNYTSFTSTTFLLLFFATLIYMIGSFGVTIFGNVPLNNTLAAFDIQSASPEQIADQRKAFEAPWNRLHGIRTIATVASLVLSVIACLSRSENILK